jgi:hypothetical protein
MDGKGGLSVEESRRDYLGGIVVCVVVNHYRAEVNGLPPPFLGSRVVEKPMNPAIPLLPLGIPLAEGGSSALQTACQPKGMLAVIQREHRQVYGDIGTRLQWCSLEIGPDD